MPSPGNYLVWITVAHFVPQVGFFASISLGVILLVLNFCGAQKRFGSYKYIISTFTLLGMMFAAMEIIVYPNVHNYKAGFIFFTFNKPFGIDDLSWRSVEKLRFFKGVCWLIWPIFCSFFGLQYALGVYVFLKMDNISTEYFREELLIRYEANVSEIPSMSLVAYNQLDDSVRWWNLMGIANIFVIVNLQYGIMIYCGWSMHTQMEDKITNFSDDLKKHHKQFFKTLVLQITAPTLILFIPISFINFVPIFNLDISLPSGALLCCFTLYPAMDSIIVMCVVSEYRKTAERIHMAVRKMLEDICGSRNGTGTVTAVNTTNATSERAVSRRSAKVQQEPVGLQN
ncbi:hypothetical protein GCK72_020712 [Caenorhabditis remanei]|uniref:Seven TM Receptor n=1 Tax=Caenorhabditis remanei TaxID=31234 RepID=A0A6A5GHY5_CAERE|nr:hypothetical protein GCK72_020712 [Caenorhabditis remanei]KAF1754152.1 hypothetical protein GCK72_020712 [Caenorhabditis remanei]